MLRICLIVVIVAGLAVGAVSLVKVRDVMIQTMNEREEFHKDRDNEKNLKDKTIKELTATKGVLKNTQDTLVKTAGELKTSEAKVATLDKQKTELMAQLETTKAARDTAQQELMKWEIINLKPEQVKGLIADLKKTTTERDTYIEESKLMSKKINQLTAKIAELIGTNEVVQLPPNLRGKIVAVDPKFQFVVLNIGDDQGVLQRGEVIASRNGKMIGKLRISSVDKSISIANILPGWQLSDLMEGDQVISVVYN